MTAELNRKQLALYALADRINRTGIEMLACTHCTRSDKLCIVAPAESKRCSECVRLKRKCDVNRDEDSVTGPSPGDWRKLAEAEDRLENETEKAETEMAELAARLARLRKQRKLLKRRGGEMLRRGMKSIEELERLEETEREKGIPPPIAPASDFPVFEDILPDFSDPNFWVLPEYSSSSLASPGFLGGTESRGLDPGS